MYWKTHAGRAIASSYFAFTSLSTVGFGDLHPQNEIECFFCAFILLFGVAIFSYCMGCFSEILESIREYYNEDDIGEGLIIFLGTLRKFNHNEPVNPVLKS